MIAATGKRRACRPAVSGDAACVEGRPTFVLHDEDRERVAEALADLLLVRALADEAPDESDDGEVPF